MMKYILIILAALTLLTVAFMGFRGTTSRQPPIMVFDDLDDQPKFKNQAGTSFFPDGREMRLAPAGTVAYGRQVAQPDKSLLVDDQAQFQLKQIPMPVDLALLERGQKLFNTYCAVCHGGFGSGTGITVQYGQAPPANYHSDRLRQAPDGYIYQVITEGKGLMGPYGPSIKQEDRWSVVAYVRALQRAGTGKMQDVPENRRGELLSGQ
jgi:mono/diheme cytochrome c family protein